MSANYHELNIDGKKLGKTLDEARHRNEMIQKKLKNVEEIESAEASSVLELPEFTE